MTTANRKTEAMQAFSRILFIAAGSNLILGLLLGGALVNSPISGYWVSFPAGTWAALFLMLRTALAGAGIFVIAITAAPSGVIAAVAALLSLFPIARQDLDGVVAHAEP